MGTRETLGAKLGPRIADLAGRAVVSAMAQGTGHRVTVGQLIVREVLRGVRSDLEGLRPGWLAEAASSPDLDEETRAVLRELSGTPDVVFIITALSTIFGVMGAAGAMGTNNLAPIVHASYAKVPNALLDPGSVAALVAKGWVTRGWGLEEARRGAYDTFKASALINAAYEEPAVGQLLQLWDRGALSESQVDEALNHIGVRPEYRGPIKVLANDLLPPAVLADAVLKGWMERAPAEREAKAGGVTRDRFATLVDVAGEPPGLMQLLEAFRRGIVNRDRLHKGIRQSRVRNEWIDVVEALRFAPPGYGTVLEGALKGHLSDAEAKDKLSEAGINPENYRWMYDATGNPPGNMQMLELLNRGEVTEKRVVDALRQGHLANRFIPDVLKLRRQLIPQGALLLIQQAGGLSRKQTIRKLMELGYSQEDAALLAETGSRTKVMEDWRAAKDLVTSQYQLGVVSRQAGEAYLQSVGFEPDEAATVLDVADLKRAVAQQNAAITRVRSLYVSHTIDAVSARNALVGLGVPAEQVADMVDLWTLERKANVRMLSESQIVSAFGYDILSQDEAQARLEQLGYPPLEAWTLLSIKSKAPLPGKPAALPSGVPGGPVS